MQIADKLSIVGKMAATLAKSNEIILALSFGVSIFLVFFWPGPDMHASGSLLRLGIVFVLATISKRQLIAKLVLIYAR